jgi:lactoylglutathione lyase
MIMSVKQLDHLNMFVKNLEETIDWYKRVFGFQLVEGGSRNDVYWAIIKGGDAMLCIYERPDLHYPEKGTVGAVNHFGLRITDRDKWEQVVKNESLELTSDGPVRYPHSWSWYVKDPTGYEIEIALWDEDMVSFDKAS